MISSNILLPFIVVLTIIGIVIFIRPSIAKHKKSGFGIKIIIGILLVATIVYTLYDQVESNRAQSEIRMAEESVDANIEKTDSIFPKGDSLINKIVIDTTKPNELRVPNLAVDSVVELKDRRVYISKQVIQNPEGNYRDSITKQINTIQQQKELLIKDQKRYVTIVQDLEVKVKEAQNSVIQTKTRNYEYELKTSQNKLEELRNQIARLDNELQRLQAVRQKLVQH
jgi:chromosome segregation ATPase